MVFYICTIANQNRKTAPKNGANTLLIFWLLILQFISTLIFFPVGYNHLSLMITTEWFAFLMHIKAHKRLQCASPRPYQEELGKVAFGIFGIWTSPPSCAPRRGVPDKAHRTNVTPFSLKKS